MTSPLVQTYRNWRKYRQTYNELMRLTERELNDLGIRRMDIRSIARESAAI
jgi:YD repeat-containing protein